MGSNLNFKKREKRYRAWDKFRKEMMGIDFDGENIGILPSCDNTGTSSYYSDGNVTLINVSYHACDIMEWIGRKDKNRVNIYEFDIVKWGFGKTKDENILRNDQILGLVVWEEEYCGFIISELTKGKYITKTDGCESELGVSFYNDNGQVFLWDDVEIIGDIYRNPELIDNSILIKNSEE